MKYIYVFGHIDLSRRYQDYLDTMSREGFRIHTCIFAEGNAWILWEREITG